MLIKKLGIELRSIGSFSELYKEVDAVICRAEKSNTVDYECSSGWGITEEEKAGMAQVRHEAVDTQLIKGKARK